VKSVIAVILLVTLSQGCRVGTVDSGAPTNPIIKAEKLSETQVIVCIGASASAGMRSKLNLARAMEEEIGASHVYYDHTRRFMVLNPSGSGRNMVDQAKAKKATLVVALDFLFWFVYGGKKETREAFFQRGLALLRQLDCPCLVGTLPYVDNGLGVLVSHYPSFAEVARFNAKIRTLANESEGRIKVIPLAQIYEAHARKRTFGGIDLVPLMNEDGLHPNTAGTLFLARVIRGIAGL
jgi:hypothetical protein